MLTKEELRQISKTTGFSMYQQEKDYIQSIALYHIYRSIGKELVFKGGTALQKVYGLNRFSEDLDFTKNGEIDISLLLEKMLVGLRHYGIECELKKEKQQFEFSTRYKIKAKGPLYSGDISSVFIRFEVSEREKTILEPAMRNIFPPYYDIPNFSLAAMKPAEILAEKVRALFTRDKARDIYDLWFLLNKKTEINYQLIGKKLDYYGLKYSKTLFVKKLNSAASSWDQELSILLPSIPPFTEVKDYLMGQF